MLVALGEPLFAQESSTIFAAIRILGFSFSCMISKRRFEKNTSTTYILQWNHYSEEKMYWMGLKTNCIRSQNIPLLQIFKTEGGECRVFI